MRKAPKEEVIKAITEGIVFRRAPRQTEEKTGVKTKAKKKSYISGSMVRERPKRKLKSVNAAPTDTRSDAHRTNKVRRYPIEVAADFFITMPLPKP